MKWVKLVVALAFWVFVVLALVVDPKYWFVAGMAFLTNWGFHLAGVNDVLVELIKLPPAPVPKCDCLTCTGIINAPGVHLSQTQRSLDIAAADAGVEPGYKSPPSAARGQFWAAPVLGLGGQLAVDREAKERADYELTKQKLAGINRHPAGKAKP